MFNFIVHSHKTDGMLQRHIDFFHKPRFDCLMSLDVSNEYVKEFYSKRDDL